MKLKESERRSRRSALKEKQTWLPYGFHYIRIALKIKNLQPYGKISKKLVIDTPEVKQTNFLKKNYFLKFKGKEKESCSKKSNES